MNRKQYFADWEFVIDGSPESHSELEAQHITENAAKFCNTHLELEFNDSGALIDAKHVDQQTGPATEGGLFRILQSKVTHGKHEYKEYRINRPYEFVRDAQGPNYLGGAPPTSFIAPKASMDFPFQYLGMLDKTDDAFSLDFDLHLICPIFLDYFDEIWIDYTDPLQPKIMNDEVLEKEHTQFDLVEGNEVIFEKINFSTSAWPAASRNGGHTGVAQWIQGPQIPVCPKTGKTMRLICQLGDGDLLNVGIERSIIPKTSVRNFTLPDDLDKYLEKMDFWGAGDLYVFFCDESRIAYYIIQNT